MGGKLSTKPDRSEFLAGRQCEHKGIEFGLDKRSSWAETETRDSVDNIAVVVVVVHVMPGKMM